MTRSVTNAPGFLGCQNRQDDAKRAKKRREALCFSLNLCQSVKSVWLPDTNLNRLLTFAFTLTPPPFYPPSPLPLLRERGGGKAATLSEDEGGGLGGEERV